MVDGQGVPMAVSVTGANTPDVQQLLPLIVAIPQVRGKAGHPKSPLKPFYADRAYESEPARAILRWLGITPFLANSGTKHGSGLGKCRWVIERTIGWLHQQRRIRVRYEHRVDIHSAFHHLAATRICFHIF
jgi:transposase